MVLGETFRGFAERVLGAVRKGGLVKNDASMLNHLLKRTEKRNIILAKGILSAMDAGGASKTDVKRFGELLDKANNRIIENKDPFTGVEQNELASIFRRAYVSKKTSGWFTNNLDELLAQELSRNILGKEKSTLGIPRKTEGQKIEEKEKEKRRIRA
jgi:hypothetical protein